MLYLLMCGWLNSGTVAYGEMHGDILVRASMEDAQRCSEQAQDDLPKTFMRIQERETAKSPWKNYGIMSCYNAVTQYCPAPQILEDHINK
jgi:hypothetical protein